MDMNLVCNFRAFGHGYQNETPWNGSVYETSPQMVQVTCPLVKKCHLGREIKRPKSKKQVHK